MVVASAVLTGAGISRGHPAGLPLGDEFHDALLRGCAEAAAGFSGPTALAGLRLLATGGRRNVLGCIEDCLDRGTVAGVLDCMRVRLPSEEHLLCALLAARGVLQLTLNFDNGIELAYGLLTGRAELPLDAPSGYRRALAAWRATTPAAPAPLRVVSTPRELARRGFTHRPLLIKLRGSVDAVADEMVVPMRPAMEDLEGVLLDDDRRHALRTAVESGHLLVTAHSGRDLDVFETLLTLLRPGGFDWVATELTDRVAQRLAAVDAGQPRHGGAAQALRSQLGRLPPWPAQPLSGPAFGQRFAAWWRQVPAAAAAEAYGWMLSDAGLHTDAISVFRAVADRPGISRHGRARVRVRLADALARRDGPTDAAEAHRLWTAAVTGRGARLALRAYSLIRQAETSAATGRPARLAALAAGAGALLFAQPDPARRRVTIRVLTGIGRIALGYAETRRSAAVARTAQAVLTRAWRGARRAGTANRQSDLELLRLRAAIVRCLLRGAPPPPHTAAGLDAVERAYLHRGNRAGQIEVHIVRAMLAVATGDAVGFRAASGAAGNAAASGVRPRSVQELARLREWAIRAGFNNP